MGTQAAMMILLHRSFSQLLLAMLVFCGLRAFVAPQERIYYGQQGSTMAMRENNHKLEETGSSIRRPVKIYVYNLPSKYNRDVVHRDPRCLNHMFATEIYIHLSLLSKGTNNSNNVYRRTWNPEEADWFYTPVYANCDLTKHGLPLIDRQAQMMHSAVHYISKRWPFWNRTEGADHFFVVPHDFGACFHFKEKAAMERGILGVLNRATLVQTFGQRNHPCMKDDGGLSTIIIPPYVPPNLIRQRLLPLSTPRSIFAYFRGVFYDTANDPEGGYYSRGVRGAIWENFKHNPLFDLSSEHPVTYYEDMQRSLFCLCPLGWAPWSPRLVESVQMGCIPVIIADDIVMPLEHVVPWSSFAVFVKESDVPFLDSILASIPPNVIQAKQNLLSSQSLKRSLLYPRPAVAGDAFHQIVKALALRLPHPPNTYLSPGHPAVLNWTAGPPADLLNEPW